MNTTPKPEPWKEVRCVSLPLEALGALAQLRGLAEIRVVVAGERAWIGWPADGGRLVPELLARRILSLPGVELFVERSGEWYKLGEHLPAFDVPFRSGAAGLPLERMVIPGTLSVLRPGDGVNNPVCIRLVRDRHERVRPATALRCALPVLAAWADRATSAQLALLEVIWRAASDGEDEEAEALVIGPPGALPLLPEAVKYWGTNLLLPLGYRAEPNLSDAAIRGVAGAAHGELAIMDLDGLELISRNLFTPVSRAGVRLGDRAAREPVPERGGRA